LKAGIRMAVGAWRITAVHYLYQYTLRSAPAAMMAQLSDAFGLSATAVASVLGLFSYGCSPFSLVAGPAIVLTFFLKETGPAARRLAR
jgi:hypothetical protein